MTRNASPFTDLLRTRHPLSRGVFATRGERGAHFAAPRTRGDGENAHSVWPRPQGFGGWGRIGIRLTRRNAADGLKSAGGFPHEMRDGLSCTTPTARSQRPDPRRSLQGSLTLNQPTEGMP